MVKAVDAEKNTITLTEQEGEKTFAVAKDAAIEIDGKPGKLAGIPPGVFVSVNLSVRKEMGGPGLPNTTTPEHLFAAGYAACFGGAIEFVAHQHKKNVAGTAVTCSTSVGPREGGGFGISVKMHVKVPTLPLEEARTLVQGTHDKVCPYSHATRGNIEVLVEVEGT